jgi:hypothetical protein
LCLHFPMLRLLIPALLAALIVGLAAACGGDSESTPLPSTAPAGPQSAELGWIERHEENGEFIEFRVDALEVTDDGWAAEVAITNETSADYALGDPEASLDRRFGLMLFKTGDLRELEQRNQADDLPGLRRADSFEPPLPLVIESGSTWSGTISARGALAAGLFARVVFGTLVPVGESPAGFPERLVWITDNSYYLKGA